MATASTDEEEPILELASECERLFADQISRLEAQNELNGAKVVGEYQQRFSAWASFLGVFAGPNLCLDRRLRHHADVRELVLRLLDILERNLFHLLEPSQSPTNETSELDQTQSQPDHPHIASDSLDAIVEAIGRLDRLGSAIRKSSVTSQATKARRFAQAFDFTSFEEIAYISLKSLYPAATHSLLEQLTRSMADTYVQFRYRQSRQDLLRPRRNVQQHLATIHEELDPEKGARSPLLSTPRQHHMEKSPITAPLRLQPSNVSRQDPTSLDSREAQGRWKGQSDSQVGKTKSILVRHANYPRPPKNSPTCEWCFAPISKEMSQGENWRQHINEDHKPYVCISEKCAESSTRFSSSSEWFRHMVRIHGRTWYRDVHSPSSWVCPLCDEDDKVFLTPQELTNHMGDAHDGTFNGQQLQAVVKQSCLQTIRSEDTCPICCMSVMDDKQPVSRKRGMTPQDASEGSSIGGSFKRLRTRTESLRMESRDNSQIMFDQQQLGYPTAMPSTSETIAIHVASHLQSIMLLTLRLISIDIMDMPKDAQLGSAESDVASLKASSRLAGSLVGKLPGDDDSVLHSDEGVDLDANNTPGDFNLLSETPFDWADIPLVNEVAAEDDAFLQEAIMSGAFQRYEDSTPPPDDSGAFSRDVQAVEEVDPDVWGSLLPFNPQYGDSQILLRKRTTIPPSSTTTGTSRLDPKGKGPAQGYRATMSATNGYLIGRHAECDIVVTGATVSNRHCVIFCETRGDETVAVLEDVSSNGTFINEALVGRNQRRELEDQDEIAILDETRFLFRYPRNRTTSAFLQQYTLLERLGKGHFAEVYLCVEKSTGMRYAAKIFTKTPGIEERAKHEGLQQEIAVLMGVSHPNILGLKDMFNETRAIYMILELAPEGELFNYIVMKQKLSEDESRKLFQQLFRAIKYLHDRNITHRDIKPENILLVDQDLHVKIADFGLAKIIGEDTFTTTLCGTPSYVAPEILNDSRMRKYTKAVDIWSLGVVLYICLCGFPPFSDELYSRDFPYTLSQQIRTGRFDYPSPYWDSVGDPALDLIDSMLLVDPTKRFTIDQCLEHPWMKQSPGNYSQGEGSLVAGFTGLQLNRRGPTRERTLLSSINSIRIPPTAQETTKDTGRLKGKGKEASGAPSHIHQVPADQPRMSDAEEVALFGGHEPPSPDKDSW